MIVTEEILRGWNCCSSGIEKYREHGSPSTVEDDLRACLEFEHFDGIKFYLKKVLSREQQIEVAIIAAEYVCVDSPSRKAIEAAKTCLADPSEAINAAAARAAARAVDYDAAAARAVDYDAAAARAAAYAVDHAIKADKSVAKTIVEYIHGRLNEQADT